MLISNILTREFTNPAALARQQQIKLEMPQFKDVSASVIARGDYAIRINGIQYSVDEFDKCVTGQTKSLLQTPSKMLVISNTEDDYDVLTPIEPINDTNVSLFMFKSKDEKGVSTMKSQKVVGTTFNETHYYKDFAGQVDSDAGTPTLVGEAILMPEPTNQYDPNAVAVIAKMADGSPFKLGYLGKGTPMQAAIKAPTMAKLVVIAYSENGDYNDSYLVEVNN